VHAQVQAPLSVCTATSLGRDKHSEVRLSVNDEACLSTQRAQRPRVAGVTTAPHAKHALSRTSYSGMLLNMGRGRDLARRTAPESGDESVRHNDRDVSMLSLPPSLLKKLRPWIHIRLILRLDMQSCALPWSNVTRKLQGRFCTSYSTPHTSCIKIVYPTCSSSCERPTCHATRPANGSIIMYSEHTPMQRTT
jgi:hypothetical protein